MSLEPHWRERGEYIRYMGSFAAPGTRVSIGSYGDGTVLAVHFDSDGMWYSVRCWGSKECIRLPPHMVSSHCGDWQGWRYLVSADSFDWMADPSPAPAVAEGSPPPTGS